MPNVPQSLPTELPSQTPLCYKPYALSTPPPLRVLGDGVYELKEPFTDWQVSEGDKTLLRLGGVVTGYTSQNLEGGNWW